MKKKLISLLIAVVLILTMLPVTAMALTAPGKPSNLKATVSGSTTKLSWTAGENCDGYIVEDFYGDFNDDEVLFDAYLVYGRSNTTCTITEQDTSVPHLIAVLSYVEDSSAPDGMTFSDPIIYLSAPRLSISKSDGKVKLSWPSCGADKYYIYRGTSPDNLSYYDTTYKNSYTNSSVTSGTRYYYKVKAVDANGGATVQSEAKSTVPVATPVMTKCDLDGSRVSLQWNAAKNATKYWVYRSTDGVNFKYYASTTSTSYTDNNITFGQDYTYYIKAVVTINGTDWSSSPSQSMSTVPLS